VPSNITINLDGTFSGFLANCAAPCAVTLDGSVTAGTPLGLQFTEHWASPSDVVTFTGTRFRP